MSLSGAQRQTSSIMCTTSHTDAAGNVASIWKGGNAACLKQLRNTGSFSDVWQMNRKRYQQQELALLIWLWSKITATTFVCAANASLLQWTMISQLLVSISYGVCRLVVFAASCQCGFMCSLWMNIVFYNTTNLHVAWSSYAIWCKVYVP